jgi:SAM-dependent methyltransferase
MLASVSDLWKEAGEASDRFAARAADYDRYRPRYPAGVFDDIVGLAGLRSGDKAIEVGAGTGIATRPLADRGLDLTAVEPAPAMAAIAAAHLGDRAALVIGRFEDLAPDSSPVRVLAAFNAWHWVDPGTGVDLAARLIEPGGSLALVWTEVVSWGRRPFEDRLADTFGSRWEKRIDPVTESMRPLRDDARFGDFRTHHHVFERTLDARKFVDVTRTYGGDRNEAQYTEIERIIDEEFGGEIVKVEDAVLHLGTRL